MFEQMVPDFVSPEECSDETWTTDTDEGDCLEVFVSPRKKAMKGTSAAAVAAFNPLQKYLSEIHCFSPLSKEEEFRLAVLYQETGDSEAAHHLVASHLLLVVKIAQSYCQVKNDLPDLIQEGNLGLLEALKRFDPHRGWRFSTYAAWWVRAYILKFILDNRKLVKVGTSNARRKLFFNLNKEKERLEAEGSESSSQILAERLQVKERDVIDLDIYLSSEEISLDAPIDAGSRRSYAEYIASPDSPPDERLAEEELDRLFWERMNRFSQAVSPRERLILEHRWLAETPMTLQEIGESQGVTRETIRLTERKLLERLRTYLKQELPESPSSLRESVLFGPHGTGRRAKSRFPKTRSTTAVVSQSPCCSAQGGLNC